ncbi:hypothetical protein LXA43DRAFT_1094971 [Ganoderma leucocontextum]|nr:hypothetical protein LXA43DRAFT_1094971 [Ganoderma leucocontextum]
MVHAEFFRDSSTHLLLACFGTTPTVHPTSPPPAPVTNKISNMTVTHRVYLASYDNAPRSSREALYHWVLLIAPEDADTNSVLTTRMYHATKRGSHWFFEHRRVDSVRSPLMLGRVQFACIDEKHLSGVVETLSDPRLIRPDERDWDCGTWAREAIVVLERKTWLKPKRRPPMSEGELDGLFRFAEQFSEKVARNRTVVGFSAPPPTKKYHGPGRMLHHMLKL